MKAPCSDSFPSPTGDEMVIYSWNYLPAVKFLLINCHSLSDRGFRDLSRAELDNKFGDDDCAMIVDKQNYLR